MPLFNMAPLRAQLPPGQRLIGIDPGSKTIGVALSDVGLMIATPYAGLRRLKLAATAAELQAIARKEGAAGLVVGWPLSMDGTMGPAAQAARDWARALSDAAGLPAALWDERLSSSAVNRFLIEQADMTRRKRAAIVDGMAAAYILQAALDASDREGLTPGTALRSMWRCTNQGSGMRFRIGSLLGVMLLATAPSWAQTAIPVPGPTVDAIKKRGQLSCGVDTGIPGFAFQDSTGAWKGFDVAYCKAVAAAVLGDASKVRYVPTTTPARFTILQSGEIDLLVRDSTLTFTRNAQLHLDEVAINFYAGQGFLVSKKLGVSKIEDLNGATICTLTGATLELNIADYARSKGTKIGTLLFEKSDEAIAAMEAGRCDGYTDDTGSLAAVRSTLKTPSDWIVLEGVISKEPLGIHIRSGDITWRNILFWIDAGLKSAEELGVTKANADQMKTSSNDPAVKRLLGAEGGFGALFGLDNDWLLRAVKEGGNYGELYDTYFGPKGLDLARGQNKLWTQGGLQYTLPFR